MIVNILYKFGLNMNRKKVSGKNRIQLVVLILSLASLFVLAGIQVAWTLRAAKMQENQFNHSVMMAINRTVDNLALNRMLCDQINNCLMQDNPGSCAMMMQNLEEWDNIKALIQEDLNYYGIDLDFEFDIIRTGEQSVQSPGKEIYLSESLEDLLEKSGYKLSISFPGRRDFIIAQMGSIFVISIILLVIVILSSLLIYRFYKRERELSGNIIDFVNSMTHAFKTPLTNISLANSMIARDGTVKDNEKLQSYTGVIKAEHKKLKQRIERLIKTSFSETDQPSFHELIDVKALVSEVAVSFSVQIKELEGSLRVSGPENTAYVYGNPDLFFIALANIVDNSIKYSVEKPLIDIIITGNREKIIITVQDKGKAVPQEHLDDIFDRYFRYPAAGSVNTEGFGLGLYQVRNIITKMGGSVNATLPDSGGLRITIDLPAVTEK